MGFSKKWIQSLSPDFNPDQFDDPLAREISWTLTSEKIRSGGMLNFETSEPGQLRTPAGMKLYFPLMYYIMLACFIILLILAGSNFEGITNKELLILSLVLFVFSFIFMKTKYRYFIFDLENRSVLQSMEVTYRHGTEKEITEVMDFSQLHAVQILEKGYRGSSGFSHTAIELNLVLVNKERFFVTDMDIKEVAKSNAAKLAEELNLPFWDATP